MPFPWAPVITGASELIGGWMGSQAAGSANARSADLQYQQQAYEKMMSDTSYQRATEDMKKAGINPMLAYMQGGASTPSTGIAQTTPADQFGKGVSNAASSAMEAETTRKMLEKIKTEIDLNKTLETTQKVIQAREASTAQNTNAHTESLTMDNIIKDAEMSSHLTGAKTKTRKAQISNKETMIWLDSILQRVVPAASAAATARMAINPKVKMVPQKGK